MKADHWAAALLLIACCSSSIAWLAVLGYGVMMIAELLVGE
jgi:hypothetical protein